MLAQGYAYVHLCSQSMDARLPLLVCSHPLVVWLQQSFDVMLVLGSSGLFLVTALSTTTESLKSQKRIIL
jgi:hypothetical protein